MAFFDTSISPDYALKPIFLLTGEFPRTQRNLALQDYLRKQVLAGKIEVVWAHSHGNVKIFAPETEILEDGIKEALNFDFVEEGNTGKTIALVDPTLKDITCLPQSQRPPIVVIGGASLSPMFCNHLSTPANVLPEGIKRKKHVISFQFSTSSKLQNLFTIAGKTLLTETWARNANQNHILDVYEPVGRNLIENNDSTKRQLKCLMIFGIKTDIAQNTSHNIVGEEHAALIRKLIANVDLTSEERETIDEHVVNLQANSILAGILPKPHLNVKDSEFINKRFETTQQMLDCLEAIMLQFDQRRPKPVVSQTQSFNGQLDLFSDAAATLLSELAELERRKAALTADIYDFPESIRNQLEDIAAREARFESTVSDKMFNANQHVKHLAEVVDKLEGLEWFPENLSRTRAIEWQINHPDISSGRSYISKNRDSLERDVLAVRTNPDTPLNLFRATKLLFAQKLIRLTKLEMPQLSLTPKEMKIAFGLAYNNPETTIQERNWFRSISKVTPPSTAKLLFAFMLESDLSSIDDDETAEFSFEDLGIYAATECPVPFKPEISSGSNVPDALFASSQGCIIESQLAR